MAHSTPAAAAEIPAVAAALPLDGTVRPLGHGLAFWAVATAAVAWTLVRRHVDH